MSSPKTYTPLFVYKYYIISHPVTAVKSKISPSLKMAEKEDI